MRISGRDIDQVFDYADRIKARLAEITGPRSIVDNWGARSKMLLVRVDEQGAVLLDHRAAHAWEDALRAVDTALVAERRAALVRRRVREAAAAKALGVHALFAASQELGVSERYAAFVGAPATPGAWAIRRPRTPTSDGGAAGRGR